jgi:alcohol dehydrogenase
LGTLVSTGATTGYDSKLDLKDLFFRGLNLIGATQGTRAGLEKVVKWTSKGKIKAIIDTVYPFEDMVMGHIKMTESQLDGKADYHPTKVMIQMREIQRML